jgi:hypothetical protein
VGAVDREPVSESEFPDLQGKYREFARNRLPKYGQTVQSGPFLGSYGAYFPEFGNREISADEQGIPRRDLRNLHEVSFSPTWTSDPEHHRLLVQASGDRRLRADNASQSVGQGSRSIGRDQPESGAEVG